MIFLFCLAALAAARAPRWHQLEARQYAFEDFKRDFRRFYSDEREEAMRKKIFDTNLQEIIRHNRDETKT